MKKVKHIFLWCFVISVLIYGVTACASDSETTTISSEGDEIEVEAKLADTRAVYPNAKAMTAFSMNGINNSTQAWAIQNINYSLNAAGKWRGSKTYTWPKAPITLSFFAVNPSFSIFDKDKSVVSYEQVSMYYTMPANAADQVDILYGSMLNQDRNTNNKKVTFTFKHGLSYQRFKGQNSLGSRYTVIVKSVTFCQVRPAGRMNYDMSKSNKVSWAIDNDVAVYDTTIDFKDENSNDGVTLQEKAGWISSTDYLLTLPQTLTLWKTKGKVDDKVSIEDAKASGLHYWEVYAKIIDNNDTPDDPADDRYLLGNTNNNDPEDPEWGLVYMQPSQKTWSLGNTYSNTLNFSKTSFFTKDGINFFDALEQATGEAFEILGADNIDTVITTEEWGYEEDQDVDLQVDVDYENSNN